MTDRNELIDSNNPIKNCFHSCAPITIHPQGHKQLPKTNEYYQLKQPLHLYYYQERLTQHT